MELKIGDVVMLKSRGPKMTVTGLTDKTGQVTCSWFTDDKSEKLSVAKFLPDALEISQ